MKKISFLLSLFIIVSCSNNDNNRYLNSEPDLKLENLVKLETDIPQDFYDDLFFTDSLTGFATSRTGKIVKTEDGGTTWQLLNSGVTFPLKKIQFISNNIGFAVGGNQTDNFILKTIDSGATWTVTNINSESNYNVNGMFFLNQSKGFIVGDHIFKKSIDGGQTWSDVFTSNDKNFQDIKFDIQSNVGYATFNSNQYYKTTDGGATWNLIDTNFIDENFKQIQIVSGEVYFKSNSSIVSLSSDRATILPNPLNKVLNISNTRAVGIGQHYEGGFFPYGDILLTNDNWSNHLQKSYTPSSDAMDFTAIAKMSNKKIMMLGTGQLSTVVITLEF